MKKNHRRIAIVLSIALVISMIPMIPSFGTDSHSQGTPVVAGEEDYNPDYLAYLKLSQEEKDKVLEPAKFVSPCEETQVTGAKTFGIARINSVAVGKLPASYDLRDSNDVSSVKDQGEEGLCWSFSYMGMLESYLLRSGNPIQYDFSERHMDLATSREYNPIGDYPGFTYPNQFAGRKMGQGGNYMQAAEYFMEGMGPIAETTMPYNGDYKSLSASKLFAMAKMDVQLDSEMTVAHELADAESHFSSVIEELKGNIKQYGAAYIQMRIAETYDTDSSGTYFKSVMPLSKSNTECNHGVLCVGWDDSIPASKFASSGWTPKGNGGWIIKNSWGKDWGTDGYFYMSYYDPRTYGATTFITEADTDTSGLDLYYRYDTGLNSYYTSGVTYGANVFAKESINDELIKEVQVYGANPTSNKISVYVIPNADEWDRTTSNISSYYCGTVDHKGAGYSTVRLATPVEITGKSFAVIAEYETGYVPFSVDPSEPVYGDLSSIKSNAVSLVAEDGGEFSMQTVYGGTAGICMIRAYTDETNKEKVTGLGVVKVGVEAATIEWNPLAGATGYEIVATDTGDGTTITYTCGNCSTVTLSGLDPGHTYSLKIKGFTGDTKKTYSDESAGTVALTTLSTANMTTGLKLYSKTTTSNKVVWTPSANASGYKICVYNYSTGKKIKTLFTSGKNWSGGKYYIITGLSPGTLYKYGIYAYRTDSITDEKVYASQSSLITGITAPSKGKISKLVTGSSHYIKAYWYGKTGSGYQVKIAKNSKFTKSVKSYTLSSKYKYKKFTKLKKGTKYYVKVRAYKTFNGVKYYGSWSSVKYITCK